MSRIFSFGVLLLILVMVALMAASPPAQEKMADNGSIIVIAEINPAEPDVGTAYPVYAFASLNACADQASFTSFIDQNVRLTNTYSSKAQATTEVARDAVIQVGVTAASADISDLIAASNDAKKEVARFEPEIGAGFAYNFA